MILIPDKPVFVRDTDGQLSSFDLPKLNEDLREAFKKNGVLDTWLVDQFSMTMEEKLRSETARKTPLAEEDINALMSSVLTASGYRDVAGSFNELRGTSPIRKILANLAPWNEERIRAVITKRLPLTHKQTEELVPICLNTFIQLGMTHVSDNFIAELAIHLVHRRHEQSQQTTTGKEPAIPSATSPAMTTKQVKSPADFKEETDELTRTFMNQQIISLYPIAPLFPRVQLALSMQQFCELHTDGWPSELSIAAQFAPLATSILKLISACRQNIADVFPSFAEAPSYVVLTHYKDFIMNYYGDASKVDRLAFNQGLHGILESYLVNRATFELKLHFN